MQLLWDITFEWYYHKIWSSVLFMEKKSIFWSNKKNLNNSIVEILFSLIQIKNHWNFQSFIDSKAKKSAKSKSYESLDLTDQIHVKLIKDFQNLKLMILHDAKLIWLITTLKSWYKLSLLINSISWNYNSEKRETWKLSKHINLSALGLNSKVSPLLPIRQTCSHDSSFLLLSKFRETRSEQKFF